MKNSAKYYDIIVAEQNVFFSNDNPPAEAKNQSNGAPVCYLSRFNVVTDSRGLSASPTPEKWRVSQGIIPDLSGNKCVDVVALSAASPTFRFSPPYKLTPPLFLTSPLSKQQKLSKYSITERLNPFIRLKLSHRYSNPDIQSLCRRIREK